ncbi:glycogen-binding subunit 76A isoform X2 [Chelonus insularis]|nr:glycogen-binding subunit 76A isoform X2 [Chelonus insularis]XP_034942744.1 glycogen-binding subunit 76A isoform X2 [Chelonus insularis]XP_034942745.1 glycogen-binding subunit 76A isoform X2 [Chelonus insularis]XP_034942747.1 glycogen-binding subunit 76A isoform X2 [Chelonus insularis]
MGSTDSPGDGHRTGPSACGLVGSIFPASCRGRAEAFARRLHHRLTSLNDTDSISTNANNSTITVSNVNDDEEEGISSPDQVVSAAELATLFVNHSELLNANHHDACHCTVNKKNVEEKSNDLESEYKFSSSVNGTTPSDDDTSETYYDLQSSDADRTEFFDTVNTFEGDKILHTSNQMKSDYYKSSSRRKIDSCDLKKIDDTSESSSSMNGHIKGINELGLTSSANCSFDETLNDINSSLDNTSLSYESLQNTFDENTTSLDDNSLPLTTVSSEEHKQTISKSCSDSLITNSNISIPVLDITPATSNHKVDVESNCLKRNEKTEELTCTSDDSGTDLTDDDNSTYSSTIDIPGALVIECPLERLPVNTVQNMIKNEINIKIDEHFNNNEINVPQLCEKMSTISCNRSDNNAGQLIVNNKTDQEHNIKKIQDNDDNKINKGNNEAEIIKDEERIEEKKEDEEQEEEEGEEEEEEEEQPQRVRRCSSLKTGKTPPGTPGRKKIVRFADVLGLDLADVRTFLDEIPKVPNSAFSDLVYDQVFSKDSSPNFYDNISSRQSFFRSTSDSFSMSNNNSIKPDKMLVPLFQQPGGLPNFLDIVRDRQVCLENVIVQDPISMCIEGTVRVRNLDFHKSVHIRYTLDSWKNFSDLQASYVNNSCDGFSDKFTFRLYCHSLKVGARLELAVRFQCKGAQYWDNNLDSNYCFQCLPTSLPVSYIPITSSHHNCNVHDWSPTFY